MQKKKQSPSKKQQYPAQSIKKIMALEESLYNKNLSLESMNQLVTQYMFAVQYFDRKQPNIRIYFLQKIQFTLSCQYTLNVINGGQNKNNIQYSNLRDTFRGTVSMLPPNVIQNPVYAQPKKGSQKTEPIIYDQNRKQRQRAVKAKMFIDVQNEIKSMQPQLRQEFVKLQNNQKKKQKQVKELILNQNNDLEARLQKRKGKRKARKSFDNNKQIQNNEEVMEPIKKEELKEIQKQISINVERFTIRNTIRQNQNESRKKKIKIREDQDQDIQIQKNKQQIAIIKQQLDNDFQIIKEAIEENQNLSKQQPLNTQEIPVEQNKWEQELQQSQEKQKKKRINIRRDDDDDDN